MARSIAGLFADRATAERAIVDLTSAGFDPTQMGIVMRDRDEAGRTAADEGGSVLLTVATPYRAQEAWEIMRRHGAEELRAQGFGGPPGQEVGRVYAEPPQDEVDGTVVPPANREDSYELQGNAVSSLTDEQHHYRQEPLPPGGRPALHPQPLSAQGASAGESEEEDQTAHQPPIREDDVLIGGWDTPDHPISDADILREATGHLGQSGQPGQPGQPEQ